MWWSPTLLPEVPAVLTALTFLAIVASMVPPITG
jgi:hypothetical protein